MAEKEVASLSAPKLAWEGSEERSSPGLRLSSCTLRSVLSKRARMLFRSASARTDAEKSRGSGESLPASGGALEESKNSSGALSSSSSSSLPCVMRCTSVASAPLLLVFTFPDSAAWQRAHAEVSAGWCAEESARG